MSDGKSGIEKDSRITDGFAFGDISRYRNEVYGFSIVWIVFFHAIAILGLDYSATTSMLDPLQFVLKRGNMGCEIFLFCSGVFLFYSMKKKEVKLAGWYVKRFTRLFWPVLLICGAYWFITGVVVEKSLTGFVSKILMVEFWISGDQQIWFVSVILVCYLFYPLIYNILYYGNEGGSLRVFAAGAIMIAAVIAGIVGLSAAHPDYYSLVEIGINRFPVFIFGCMCSRWVYDNKRISALIYVPAAILTAAGFYVLELGVLSGCWKRLFFFFPAMGLTVMLILVFKLVRAKAFHAFFSFFGKISLNLYLAHILVIRLYKLTPFVENKCIRHYLVIVVISVILAWVSSLIIDGAGGLLRKKKTA
ncbi:MAG: acyltransferase [Eubacterium sp.]|nr:acyltransferase [Eubacterium sp.]